MKALVVNAVGGRFDFEDVDIAAPIGCEVLVDVKASGLCHTDLLFGAHDFAPTLSMLGHSRRGRGRGRPRRHAHPRRRSCLAGRPFQYKYWAPSFSSSSLQKTTPRNERFPLYNM
jgi:hypothetical protein